uniref:Ig-like domain-containing protein n=1 Tax=Anas zonorhyncha TaxID=75864 RepID=A0A8B9ZQM4_9AVES
MELWGCLRGALTWGTLGEVWGGLCSMGLGDALGGALLCGTLGMVWGALLHETPWGGHWRGSALRDPGDLGGALLCTEVDGGTEMTFLPPHPPAGAFLMQVASSCPLAANGSVMGFDFTLSFNKNPLVCYDPDNQRFVACNWGLLQRQAMQLAARLNNGSTWVQRIEARRQACSDLALRFWDWTVLRRTQPQVRIIPAETGNARVPVRLTCHIWGFYPPEVTVIWLHNGDIVEPDDYNPISAIPNGDWSYQTHVSLLVAPVAGDTYTCSVQHVSLQEPLLEDWSPGLMPEVTILVVVATVLMVLGLGLFLAGVYRYKARPPAPGYTPLPGDNYPAGSI